MKENFRQAADRQLSDVKFTESMKLNVLASAARTKRPAYTKYLAAAAILVIIFGAALMYGISPSPDNIAGNNPGITQFTSDDIHLTVTSVDWSGYFLTVGYTLESKAETDLNIEISPFIVEDDALYADAGTETFILASGERVLLTSCLKAADCRPGQNTAVRFTAKATAPGKAAYVLPASIDVTVPAEMRLGTIIKTGETSSNGLFSATVGEAVFTPQRTSLKLTVSAEQALRQKESCEFFITFSSADGDIRETFPLPEYRVQEEYSVIHETLYIFDETLSFAPAEITITCDWKKGDTSGTAEACFGRTKQ